VDRKGAAERGGPGLRQAEMLDLAFPDQFLDRSRDVFDLHLRIDAMLVEQVDRMPVLGRTAA
jgi:hypothetical protein